MGKNPKKMKGARGRLLPLAFIGPHLILFTVFSLIPILFGIYISFTRWDMIRPPVFVGLDNFSEIFLNGSSTYNRQFQEGFRNTFLFVIINVPLCISIPLGFAMLLHIKPPLSRIFQSILYLPTLFSVTAVGIIWMQLLNRRFGLVAFFRPAVAIATAMPYAWIALMIMTTWWTMGTNMIIYLASLGSIPRELYESAEIDGARSGKRFFYITLPSIRFQILYTLVITIAGSFNIYGQPTIMTRVDPANAPAIKVLVYHIRGLAFGSGQSVAGMASAMAVVLGLCIMIVSFFQFTLIRRENT
jgi:multiple sugar transport system permease protein